MSHWPRAVSPFGWENLPGRNNATCFPGSEVSAVDTEPQYER